MLLLELPEDILLTLIEILPSKTLIRFSLACRKFLNLASSIIKQRKYGHLYNFTFVAMSSKLDTWRHSIEVISNIRQDSGIVHYIDEIQFRPGMPDLTNHDWPRIIEEHKSKLRDCNYLEDELNDLTFLSQSEMQRWKKDMQNGDQGACLAVLLSLCTNATCLSLIVAQLPTHLDAIVDFLNDEYRHTLGPNDQGQTLPSSKLILPKLKTLDIRCDVPVIQMSLQHDFRVLEIPTLRTLYFQNLGAYNGKEDWTWRARPGRSCWAEVVHLRSCIFRPAALADFVRCLPQLRCLVYDCLNHTRVWEEWTSVEKYAQCIWETAESLWRERSLQIKVDREADVISLSKVPEDVQVQEPLNTLIGNLDKHFSLRNREKYYGK